MEYNYSWSSGLLEELVGMEHYRNEELREKGIAVAGGWNVVDESNSWFQDFSDLPMPMPMDQPLISSPAAFSSESSNTNFHSQTLLPYSNIFAHHQHQHHAAAVAFDLDICKPASTSKLKLKAGGGQPSKNLMAERRRRKRLNDRLSMLRSVVPKISKMDRTSILGDTIDYMKELVDSINKLGGNIETIFKNINGKLITNSPNPKFEVERRNSSETRIEICCGGRAGLLVSTVTTLEALGIDIHHCVISCFNDFAMQASCSHPHPQDVKVLDSEDIKQALFRNAGTCCSL